MMDIQRVTLEGTGEEMGLQHGELLKEKIHELAEERVDIISSENAGITLSDIRVAAEETADEIRRQVPDVYAETSNTARAANVDYWRLIVAGGYSDIENRVTANDLRTKAARSDCTLLPWSAEAGNIFLAGTWDSHATAEAALVMVERRPTIGPWTLALSTAGWPMQQGVTSVGIGFAIANVVAKTSQAGISYIAALPAIAASTDLQLATQCAEDLVLCSARFYALCDTNGNYVGIETDGRQYWHSTLLDVHTNHFVYEDARAVEGRDKKMSELRRQKALAQLRAAEPSDSRSLFRVLEFNDGTDSSISRRAVGRETRSCAGFVLDPKARSVHVTAGPPGLSSPRVYSLDCETSQHVRS